MFFPIIYKRNNLYKIAPAYLCIGEEVGDLHSLHGWTWWEGGQVWAGNGMEGQERVRQGKEEGEESGWWEDRRVTRKRSDEGSL